MLADYQLNPSLNSPKFSHTIKVGFQESSIKSSDLYYFEDQGRIRFKKYRLSQDIFARLQKLWQAGRAQQTGTDQHMSSMDWFARVMEFFVLHLYPSSLLAYKLWQFFRSKVHASTC